MFFSFHQIPYVRSLNGKNRFVFPSVRDRDCFPFPKPQTLKTPAVKLQYRALTFGFGSILHTQMGLRKVQSSEECCKLLSQVKI